MHFTIELCRDQYYSTWVLKPEQYQTLPMSFWSSHFQLGELFKLPHSNPPFLSFCVQLHLAIVLIHFLQSALGSGELDQRFAQIERKLGWTLEEAFRGHVPWIGCSEPQRSYFECTQWLKVRWKAEISEVFRERQMFTTVHILRAHGKWEESWDDGFNTSAAHWRLMHMM